MVPFSSLPINEALTVFPVLHQMLAEILMLHEVKSSPGELGILVEAEMIPMSSSVVSCQDHLKTGSVIICIVPRCVM